MSDVMIEIRKWHLEYSKDTLGRYFKLGDMLLQAVIQTGLRKSKVMGLAIEAAGQYAVSRATYAKAMMLAGAFSSKQREVLINTAVPFNQAVHLSSEAFDNTRARMLAKIKAGEIKYPFVQFNPSEKRKKMAYMVQTRREHNNFREDSVNNPDRVVVQMTCKGSPDAEGRLAGLKCIMSRMGREAFEALLVMARRELGWK